MVNMECKDEFQRLKSDLGNLCTRTVTLLEEKKVELNDLKECLQSTFPELNVGLQTCESLSDVIHVIRPRLSLVAIGYLKCIFEWFSLPVVFLEAYKENTDFICGKMRLDHAYGQLLMELKEHISIIDSVTFVLNWEGDEHYLSDIQDLFKALFGEYSSHVKVKVIYEGNSVVVECYVPSQVQPVIVRLMKEGVHILVEKRVKSVTAGGATIFNASMTTEFEKV